MQKRFKENMLFFFTCLLTFLVCMIEEIWYFAIVVFLGPLLTFLLSLAVFIPLSLLAYRACLKQLDAGFLGKLRRWVEAQQSNIPEKLRFAVLAGEMVALFAADIVAGPIITAGFIYLLGFTGSRAIWLVVLGNFFCFAVVTGVGSLVATAIPQSWLLWR